MKVYHVSALRAISPYVRRVPENLRCPYAFDGAVVLIDVGRLRVTENVRSPAEVEGGRSPVNQVVTFQQVDAVVEPRAALGVAHVGSHHQIAFSVGRAADKGIACSSLYF